MDGSKRLAWFEDYVASLTAHADLPVPAEVREGILRFVREGGGIGGNHAVTFADNNWPEFAEMMGGWAGAHHTEKQMVKVDDPSSPLMKSFGPMSFEHTDEFYQFPVYSPCSSLCSRRSWGRPPCGPLRRRSARPS